jgi:hypothetical protein
MKATKKYIKRKSFPGASQQEIACRECEDQIGSISRHQKGWVIVGPVLRPIYATAGKACSQLVQEHRCRPAGGKVDPFTRTGRRCRLVLQREALFDLIRTRPEEDHEDLLNIPGNAELSFEVPSGGDGRRLEAEELVISWTKPWEEEEDVATRLKKNLPVFGSVHYLDRDQRRPFVILRAPESWAHRECVRDGFILISRESLGPRLASFDLNNPRIAEFFPSLREWIEASGEARREEG